MKRTIPLLLIALLTTGCTNNDDRLVEMAREHEKRQAEQSQQMARMQHTVAEGSRNLVEADAKAREALSKMQQDLRGDQAAVGQQRDALEAERKEIAAQRFRDPILAAAILQVGTALACLLPLLLAGYLIWSMKHTAGQDDAAVTELLVTELVSERPLLLPAPVTACPALPSPDTTPITTSNPEG